MKTYLSIAAACLALQVAAPAAQAAEPQAASAKSNTTQIEQLLNKYEQALNSSDVNAAVQLYTDDAVLMPQATPTVVGGKAVKQFYIGTFKTIKINLKFQIAEVQVVSNEWAFLRTTSTGSMKVLATGTESPARTQELFVLHKESGQWKLARYSFSSTQPAGM